MDLAAERKAKVQPKEAPLKRNAAVAAMAAMAAAVAAEDAVGDTDMVTGIMVTDTD